MWVSSWTNQISVWVSVANQKYVWKVRAWIKKKQTEPSSVITVWVYEYVYIMQQLDVRFNYGPIKWESNVRFIHLFVELSDVLHQMENGSKLEQMEHFSKHLKQH